jgi:membrane protease subunit HflC
MKHRWSIVVGTTVVACLLVYMFTYQARYDQVAVVTTFDKASAASVQRQPGLRFKWPWPIQKVTRYSTRIQLLEHRLEQLQTRDGKSVVVQAYLAWRIDDPLRFFIELENMQAAADKLAPLLSEQVSGSLGLCNMDELVNTDPARVKLADVEARVLASLRGQLATLNWGIQAEHVGIRRLVLPAESTAKVFETMRQTRQRLAASARSSGKAQAATIKSQALSAQKRILAFAQRCAQSIRAQGDQEAAQYYAIFNQDEPLAIFLRKIETLRTILPHNTTFVLDSDQLSLDELFSQPTPQEPNVATPLAPAPDTNR